MILSVDLLNPEFRAHGEKVVNLYNEVRGENDELAKELETHMGHLEYNGQAVIAVLNDMADFVNKKMMEREIRDQAEAIWNQVAAEEADNA